jgi:glycosyltransferase involved in cell wall biosynthesis
MNINICGVVNNLSYGIVTTNIVRSLISIGHKVALFPINPNNMECEPHLQPSIRMALENAKTLDFYAPCIRIWHQFDMSQFVGKGKKIGFPIFELNRFNKQEKHHLYGGCDQLFVCSKWAKEICERELPLPLVENDNVKVIPLGVDLSIFSPVDRPSNGPFVFLNCGKWERRKGHDILVHAFNKAFSDQDDVELWMMPTNCFNTPEENYKWESLYLESKLGHKIKLIDRQDSQKDVANFMRRAHCGIFPARAEGWNLEALEMLACAKPLIISANTGHTEYITWDNSFWIDTPNMEPAHDGKWFHGQGDWHSIGGIEVNKIADIMRYAYNQGPVSNDDGYETACKFTWINTAKEIIGALNE